jgi:aryl-alcohol dehydrogenase-like predicted oxidoreductase
MRNKLALGTVQFGLNYGVTNKNGQVTIGEVRNILDFAKNNGIDTLDTAASYGNSEKILGEIGIHDCQIITKTTSFKDGTNEVINNFYQSLKKLNVGQVEGLLIHNIDDIKINQFDILFKRLDELKKEGLVKKIGFSTYMPEQVDFLLENFDFDLIQLPFNIFDVRLIEGGQLQALKSKNVEVHARSVFLQGVLLDFYHHSSYFITWQEQFEKYQAIVKESGVSLLEYALNFVLNIQEIDKVLVGVNSEIQLNEIIQSIKESGNFDAYPIDDINLLNPSLWKI